MTKKVKSTNNEQVEKKRQTPRQTSTWLFDYYNTQKLKKTPVTEATVERWVEDLLSFPYSAEGKGAKFLSDWYLKRGIPRATFHEMCNKFPQLKAAREVYLETVGTRMYANAIDRKADLQAVKHIIHRYYPEAAADDQHQVDLKKQIVAEEARNKPTTINVSFDNMKELIKDNNE